MTEAMREQFEAEFSKPPYEFPMERGNANAGWPGQYRDYSVQCAWEGYQAALRSPAVAGLVEALREFEREFLYLAGRTDFPLQDRNRWSALAATAKAAIAPFTGAGHE